MKAKHKRLFFIVSCMIVMALSATLILYSLRDNMVFFYTPTEYIKKTTSSGFTPSQTLRIGGLVKTGSVVNLPGGGIRFVITDLTQEMPATYHGMVPSLFRDGQGVVAQGTVDAEGIIVADSILAKHDEKYMPREVVEALKASGQWKDGGQVSGSRFQKPPKAAKPETRNSEPTP